MSDENYISFSDAGQWLIALIIFFAFLFVMVIFIPLGFMYIWWDCIIRPKNNTEIFGTLFFGSIVQFPLLMMQIDFVYPVIYAFIIGMI